MRSLIIVTKSEFQEWKVNPVTRMVMQGFKERIETLKEGLAQTAGSDPQHDRFTVGAIQAYSDILNVEFSDD